MPHETESHATINPLADHHFGQLETTQHELGDAMDALQTFWHGFKELNDFSTDGTRYILQLIYRDIESIHDDLQRHLEGRCMVRTLKLSSLRPPEDFEKTHNRVLTKLKGA